MQMILTHRNWMEIREKVQLLETIIDGETQRKKPNKSRLSLALSNIRSIQTKYFPQVNYSMYYFRGGHGVGNQPLNRTNYSKWKKLKALRQTQKLSEYIE